VVDAATALAAASASVLCGALPARGGCYDISVAGSGVYREARDRACVRYAEEVRAEKTSAKVGVAGAEETSTCDPATSADPVSKKCAQNKCDVTIGGNSYCSQCSKNDDHLVDGKCVAADEDANSNCVNTNNQGTCTQCNGQSFMYQGGCYQTGDQNPGNTLCTAASDGKCTTAAEGYFVPPSATADKQSVISCSESTPVTLADGKQYKGVSNCLVCTAPTTTESTPNLAVCTTCTDGKYGSDCAGTCHLDCKTCAGGNTNDKCTSCKSTGKTYFKKGDGETGECVEKASCNGSYFPNDDVDGKKQCIPCGDSAHGGIADCKTCAFSQVSGRSTLTCSVCTPDTKKPNADGTKCVECAAAGCAKCSDEGVCLQCSTGKLTPTGQCVDSCDKLGGYYKDNNNICQPCSPECASCTAAGADKCLSCPAGKALKYTSESSSTDGTCVDECKTNTGGCTDCGAAIGGSRYCSKCGDASQAPLNGDCAANTARTKFCTNASNGACTQCKWILPSRRRVLPNY
ncbi:Variant-specific surface protein, partial [Giardia duodenalis]